MKTYLRGKTTVSWRMWEKREEKEVKETILQIPASEMKGVGRCSRHQSWDFPCSHEEDQGEGVCPAAANTMPEQVFTLQAVEDSTPERGYTLKETAAHGEPLLKQASDRSCQWWGTHTQEVCSWRAVPCGVDLHDSSSWKTAACWEDPW